MGSYPSQVAPALRNPGWGFRTVGGGIDPGDHRFRPRFIRVVDVRKYFSDSGMEPYPPRVALALQTPGWGFHTVQCGVEPGNRWFIPDLLEL